MYSHTKVYWCIGACIHAYTGRYIGMYVCVHRHTHMRIHVYVHGFVHTEHVYIRLCDIISNNPLHLWPCPPLPLKLPDKTVSLWFRHGFKLRFAQFRTWKDSRQNTGGPGTCELQKVLNIAHGKFILKTVQCLSQIQSKLGILYFAYRPDTLNPQQLEG